MDEEGVECLFSPVFAPLRELCLSYVEVVVETHSGLEFLLFEGR
jgi:hypothetical protein